MNFAYRSTLLVFDLHKLLLMKVSSTQSCIWFLLSVLRLVLWTKKMSQIASDLGSLSKIRAEGNLKLKAREAPWRFSSIRRAAWKNGFHVQRKKFSYIFYTKEGDKGSDEPSRYHGGGGWWAELAGGSSRIPGRGGEGRGVIIFEDSSTHIGFDSVKKQVWQRD